MLYQRCARWSCLLAVVASGWGGVAVGGEPDSPDVRKVNFHIAQQPVGDALTEFGEQSGLAIAVPAALAHEVIARPLNGEYTPDEALSELLGPIGLRAEYVDSKTVTVRTAQVANKKSPDVSSPPQFETTSLERLEAGDSVSGNSSSAASEDKNVRSGHGSAQSSAAGTVDEVVVTGSRLKQSPDSDTLRVVTFTKEKIAQLGVANVADVLKYLPQQSFSSNEAQTQGGSRTVQLRGLEVGATLILINGRRTVTSALLGSSNAFDLNTIPLSAVDRIEILPDSASAVYGADAVGGVVNIILKRNISSPVVDAYLGSADDGARERRASVSIGHSSQRSNVSLVLDAFDRSFLMGDDRDRFSDADFRRYGSSDMRLPYADPGNVCAVGSATLPGLTTRCAAVPKGSSGVGLTPAAFAATAGQTNLDSLLRFTSVVPETKRLGALLSTDFAISDRVTAFGEFLYAHHDDLSYGSPQILANTTVPATNAFNPFGKAVAVSYDFAGLPPRSTFSEAESFRTVLGLRGAFGSKWDWEAYGMDIRENGRVAQYDATLNAAHLAAVLASPDPNQALNLFQDGPGGSSALLASLISPSPLNKYSSSALQGSALVRGSVASIPGGDVQAVLGTEVRREEIALNSSGAFFKPERTSSSAYTEIRLPLVAESMGILLINSLSVTAAGRYDHYSDFGHAFNPKYSVDWKPTRRVLVTGGYGTSYRAPSLFELYQPKISGAGFANDPLRGNVQTPYTYTLGGNQDLQPEDSRSWEIGSMVAGGSNDQMRLGASYWNVGQTQRIGLLSPVTVLANESAFPGRVTRASPTPADLAKGQPGQLLSIDAVEVNAGRLITSGVDSLASYRFDTSVGTLTTSASATWVRNYLAATLPNLPTVQLISVASTTGTIPRWKGVAGIEWRRHAFSLAATARYISSYKDATASGVRTGLLVRSQTLVDMSGEFDVDSALRHHSLLFPGMVVRVGAINLFNKEPPFSSIGTLQGYDASQGDLRQRFLYVSLSVKF